MHSAEVVASSVWASVALLPVVERLQQAADHPMEIELLRPGPTGLVEYWPSSFQKRVEEPW